ncbi:MAG: hypothetical protein JNM78_13840 [Cyclobacteriaceae bacterium]|nr:hypothetical protein [Cyclobacteriaceae bacterium]
MKTYLSKVMYYGGIAVIIINLVVFSFIFIDSFEKGNVESAMVLSIFNGCLILMLLFYMKKYVYVITLENNKLIIGSLFFESLVSQEVVEISRLRFLARVYKIKYNDKIFWFGSTYKSIP